MSVLRKRMDDAMVLRGLALRTRETYLACVKALARHYRRPPDELDAAAIQTYLLHLITEKNLAYVSVNQAACAIRFLFAAVLGRKDLALEIPMAKVPKRLPQVLTRDEIKRLFAAAANLRTRTVLMTTYAAGLRVSEVCALQLSDIESAPERMCLKVRQGKGGQDRYTLLSARLLDLLRRYWRDCRPALWLFPDATGNAPMRDQTAQRMYWAARDRAGLANRGGIHTLRHSFATHLLEAGVDIHTIEAPARPRPRRHDDALLPFGALAPHRHPLAARPAQSRLSAACARPAWPRCSPTSVRSTLPRSRCRVGRPASGAPFSPAAPPFSAATSTPAMAAGRAATSITRAATGIARAARAAPRRRGWRRGGAKCCRCRTFTWCSPCRTPSSVSSELTRGRSTRPSSAPSRPR